MGAHRFDPLVVNEVYIPRKSALKIRLKLLDSAGVVSGFYITGFEPNCLAQTQDLVRERDKVEEVNGQILTVDMTLEEVNDLMNSAADKFVRLGIKRKAKKPLLRQYSGSDLPAQTIVTQRMIDDKTEEVEKAYAAKKKIRKEIKKWTKDFEKKENRVPSEEDKKGAPQLFKPLDQVSNVNQWRGVRGNGSGVEEIVHLHDVLSCCVVSCCSVVHLYFGARSGAG